MRIHNSTPFSGISNSQPTLKVFSIRRIAVGLLVLGGLASAPTSIAAGTTYTENTTIGSGEILSAPYNYWEGPTFEKDLHFEQGSIFSWNITGNMSYTPYGKVNVSGNLTGSDAIFRVVSEEGYNGDGIHDLNFWDEEHYWHDIFFDGNDANGIDRWTWMFSHIESDAPLSKGSFGFRHNALRWSPVPEPTSAVAGLLLLAGVFRRRRD